MVKKTINLSFNGSIIKNAFYCVKWPAKNVLALTTTCHFPFAQREAQQNPQPFLQQGEISLFPSFNLGTHVGDNLSVVLENREVLLNLITEIKKGITSESALKQNKIQWLDQVHSADVANLNEHSQIPLTADASITSNKSFALAIMTADCLPILLSAKDGSEIAAIHGGWRSLSLGIISNTLNKMTTSPENICAWLGPCIGDKAFEVGQEVKNTFIAQSPKFEKAFSLQRNNKYLASLALIAQQQLNDLGVFDISRLSHCTYSSADNYYSYRRDGQTGRMATVIVRV